MHYAASTDDSATQNTFGCAFTKVFQGSRVRNAAIRFADILTAVYVKTFNPT
jgi:hypothetical protein